MTFGKMSFGKMCWGKCTGTTILDWLHCNLKKSLPHFENEGKIIDDENIEGILEILKTN